MAALLVLLVSGCNAGSAVNDFGKVVQGEKGGTTQVEVVKGQRFSLSVPENPSVGDAWELVAVPDPKVASFISKERVGGGDEPGSGGSAYFVFNAKHPGTTEVKLYDCYRCSGSRTPSAPDSVQNSGTATFTVTVS